MAVPHKLQECRQEQLYFAFGSNLCLDQMAQRCPTSRYIGVAELPDYRFQINQRGFANVVYLPGDYVAGLVYLLGWADEERLDRNEGVPTAYQRTFLTVNVFTANIAHIGRAVPELAQQLKFLKPDIPPFEAPETPTGSQDQLHRDLNLHKYDEEGMQLSESRQKPELCATQHNIEDFDDSNVQIEDLRAERCSYQRTNGQPIEALVYISENFHEEGEPRNEYIDRMNAGIIYASKLGMSLVHRGLPPALHQAPATSRARPYTTSS